MQAIPHKIHTIFFPVMILRITLAKGGAGEAEPAGAAA